MKPFNFSYWTDTGGHGSALIGGSTVNAWLSVAASTDWAIGTGDFTVEWFQYQTNNGNENFIFNVGSNMIATSVASGGNRLNIYLGGSRVSNPSVSPSISTWYHVAISRTSGTLNVYFNGTRVDTLSNSTNINDSSSVLYVGTQNNTSPYGDNWPGNITNFRWIKGTGLYTTATITIPNRNLLRLANTKLLLLFQNSGRFLVDSSGTWKTVLNGGVPVYSTLTPFQ